MHDAFATTILQAVRQTNPAGLFVAVDDLGTTVQGEPARVFAYAEELFVRAAAAADHVTAVMQFSAGGDPVAEHPAEPIPEALLPAADFPVAASWTLYPLGTAEYVPLLTRVVEEAVRASGVDFQSVRYASRLDGSAAAIFQTLRTAFIAMRTHVPHTVIHTVLSKGSPSTPGAPIDVYGQE